MDVTIENVVNKDKIKVYNNYAIHLHHFRDYVNFRYDICKICSKHGEENYGCKYHELPYNAYIHTKCHHKTDMDKLIEQKLKYFGDKDLYRSDRWRYANCIPNDNYLIEKYENV